MHCNTVISNTKELHIQGPQQPQLSDQQGVGQSNADSHYRWKEQILEPKLRHKALKSYSASPLTVCCPESRKLVFMCFPSQTHFTTSLCGS